MQLPLSSMLAGPGAEAAERVAARMRFHDLSIDVRRAMTSWTSGPLARTADGRAIHADVVRELQSAGSILSDARELTRFMGPVPEDTPALAVLRSPDNSYYVTRLFADEQRTIPASPEYVAGLELHRDGLHPDIALLLDADGREVSFHGGRLLSPLELQMDASFSSFASRGNYDFTTETARATAMQLANRYTADAVVNSIDLSAPLEAATRSMRHVEDGYRRAIELVQAAKRPGGGSRRARKQRSQELDGVLHATRPWLVEYQHFAERAGFHQAVMATRWISEQNDSFRSAVARRGSEGWEFLQGVDDLLIGLRKSTTRLSESTTPRRSRIQEDAYIGGRLSRINSTVEGIRDGDAAVFARNGATDLRHIAPYWDADDLGLVAARVLHDNDGLAEFPELIAATVLDHAPKGASLEATRIMTSLDRAGGDKDRLAVAVRRAAADATELLQTSPTVPRTREALADRLSQYGPGLGLNRGESPRFGLLRQTIELELELAERSLAADAPAWLADVRPLVARSNPLGVSTLLHHTAEALRGGPVLADDGVRQAATLLAWSDKGLFPKGSRLGQEWIRGVIDRVDPSDVERVVVSAALRAATTSDSVSIPAVVAGLRSLREHLDVTTARQVEELAAILSDHALRRFPQELAAEAQSLQWLADRRGFNITHAILAVRRPPAREPRVSAAAAGNAATGWSELDKMRIQREAARAR